MTGHNEYKALNPAVVKAMTGKEHPVIVDGRNIVNPDDFVAQGFIYKGIGRGDKNSHPIVHDATGVKKELQSMETA
jgi:UDP-N-acetyl-D-mannosaminuronic acid dehydrogenase